MLHEAGRACSPSRHEASESFPSLHHRGSPGPCLMRSETNRVPEFELSQFSGIVVPVR